MSQFGMPSYFRWTSQAQRWQKVVDFASPMTAWTPLMRKLYNKHGGDVCKATEELRKLRNENRLEKG